MVIVIDKKMGKEQIAKQLKKAAKRRRIGDKKRFFGAVKWKEDPLEYQKRLRNEWP